MPTASYPRDYARHTWVLIQDVHAWLNRDELGFYALDAACPHLGCVIRAAGNHFVCPCHKSSFASSGDILSGPAQTRLRYLRVDLNADGKLIICRDQVVSPDDRFIA
jgi:Rieske Fe-S protein